MARYVNFNDQGLLMKLIFLLLALVVATFSMELHAEESGFYPAKATEGSNVKFVYKNPRSGTHGCSVSGLPGLSSNHTSGDVSFNFVASKSLKVKVTCGFLGPIPPNPDPDYYQEIITNFQFTVAPVITMSFPDGIYVGMKYPLKITHRNTQSCALFIGSSSYPTVASVPSSYEGNYEWSNGAGTTQAFHLKCIGEDGVAVNTTKSFTLTAYPGDPKAPQITHFGHGNLNQGNTGLYWSTQNVSQCKLSGMGITANVSTTGIAYNVTVPFGNTKFTLACSNGAKTVTKDLVVTRSSLPGSGGGGGTQPVIELSDLPIEVMRKENSVSIFEQAQALDDENHQIVRFFTPDENIQGVLVIDRIKNHVDAYIYNEYENSSEHIATIFGLLDARDIDSIVYDTETKAVSIVLKK